MACPGQDPASRASQARPGDPASDDRSSAPARLNRSIGVSSQSEKRLGAERRLLGLRGEPPELGLSYSHSDLGKRPTKDSYTLTEELAEYAEIRVK